MNNLKNCPFCGGVAERGIEKITEFYYEAQAHCCYCGCEIRHKFSIPHYAKDPEREAKRLISRMWNRRVTMADAKIATTTLKPCPMCGGNVNSLDKNTAVCTKCGVKLRIVPKWKEIKYSGEWGK